MSVAPGHPEQKRILIEFCEAEIKAQTAYLSEKYKLRKYKPQLLFNWRTNAVASYGGELIDGEPFVSLLPHEVWQYVGTTDKYIYDEYSFLHSKPGIGMGEANWKQHIAWTMAHEMAHTVIEIKRFRNAASKFYSKDITSDLRQHGEFWQVVYRDLRTLFCVEERYPVEFIDLSNAVHFSSKRVDGQVRFTFYKNNEPVARYIRENGQIFKTEMTWDKKRATTFKKPSEITRWIVDSSF